MPSRSHDGLVELFEHAPRETARLLGRIAGIPLPDPGAVRSIRTSVRQTRAVEQRADVVLQLGAGERKRLLVVEVQRAKDRDKPWRWPRYVVVLRDTHRCPVHLVVLATKRPVADWARRPVEALPGSPWRPVVIGPDDLPRLEDVPAAERTALGALLSIVLHVRTTAELAAVEDALEAVWPPPDLDDIGGARGYTEAAWALMPPDLVELVEALMSQIPANDAAAAARASLMRRYDAAHQTGIEKGIRQGIDLGIEKGIEKGIDIGRCKATRDLFIRLVLLRGAALTPGQREVLEGCGDVARLSVWVERLASGATVDEAFAG